MAHWKSSESPRSGAEIQSRYERAGPVTGSLIAAFVRSLLYLLGGMLEGFCPNTHEVVDEKPVVEVATALR